MAKATLSDLGLTTTSGSAVITGLAVDSRDVKPGYLFAALPGAKVHGAAFVDYALRQGASAILTDAGGAAMAAAPIAQYGPAVCVVQDPRQALAGAAALWFGRQPPMVAAVTGTNGKTSVTTFCRQLWIELGARAVNLGTTGVEGCWTAPNSLSLAHTTPEPITLHRTLCAAAQAGVSHVAMEASSHGLDQRRLDGVTVSVAGFSNFTQDHLDYHGSFDGYFAAKMGLFNRVLAPDGLAVVNLDDSVGTRVRDIAYAAGHDVMTVGRAQRGGFAPDRTAVHRHGSGPAFYLAGAGLHHQSGAGGWLSGR